MAVALFVVALGIRLYYQSEAQVYKPLRADAHKYFSVAFNMAFHGVYSPAPAFQRVARPKPEGGLRAGYPLFLYPFVKAAAVSDEYPFFARREGGLEQINRGLNAAVRRVVNAVTTAQALLGSITVVLTFILALSIFPLRWALVAALLTALCPHLVAMEGYVLTETLFTFVLVAACVLLVFASRNGRWPLGAVAGVLLGFEVFIRPAAILLVPFAALACLLRAPGDTPVKWQVRVKPLGALLAASIMVFCVPRFFLPESSATDERSVESTFAKHFILGADVKLERSAEWKKNPQLSAKRKRMEKDTRYMIEALWQQFRENPVRMLGWYLGGKILFLWRWDNFVSGDVSGSCNDVYQYPMLRRGFHTGGILVAVHSLMKLLHWPLFCFTLLSVVFIATGWRAGRVPHGLIVPLLVLTYFAVLFTVLMPLPRYSLPMRPLSYVLAVYGLQRLWGFIGKKERKERNKCTDL